LNLLQVMFEAVASQGYQGDIALDDISVIDGPCSAPKVCGFEFDDQCGYSNLAGYPLQWFRDRNGTSSVGTGPSRDHTTQSDQGTFFL